MEGMKTLFAGLAFAATAALFAMAPALAQTSSARPVMLQIVPAPAPTPQLGTMYVQGNGLVERAPDLARLSVSIVTNDDNATVSSSKNNDIYNAFKAAVASLGITADNLRTLSYNVVFVPHPARGLPPEQQLPRYGYITTRTMSVTIAPIENVGKVIDAATGAGVTNVGSVSFDLKDRKGAYNAALTAAMTDAKTTAALLATTGGFSIVRVLTVNVNSTNPPLQTIARVMAAPQLSTYTVTPTDLQPGGPISISAQVSVTYVIR